MVKIKNRSLLFKKILVIILSPLIFFMILELCTRIFWNYDNNDTDTGIILSGTERNVKYKGIEYITNSYGIRNKEITHDTSESPIILVLGDSFIWGHGLHEESLVTTKIENILKKKYSESTVINTGICGYDTRDEYYQLKKLYPVYSPDHVILFFFTNDIIERDENLKRVKLSWYLRLKEFLRKNSRFFRYCYYKYKSNIVSKYGVSSSLIPEGYKELDDNKKGWVDFKKYTLKIEKFCANNKITFTFVIIPTLIALNENYPYKELHNKVKEFVSKSDIPLIDLLPVFQHYPAEDLWINPENTHWNDHATTLASENVSKYLLDSVINNKMIER